MKDLDVAQAHDLVNREPVDDLDPQGAAGQLSRLCRATSRALPAAGAGVSVLPGPALHGVTVGSSVRSRTLEELQFILGEGPCQDAIVARRPVLVPDISGVQRQLWPAYCDAAFGEGVRAVFAFPMQMGVAQVGVLDVYRDASGPLSPAALTTAKSFASVATMIVLEGQEIGLDGDMSDELGAAMEYQTELYQAQGMVMVQIGGSLDEAMVRMRAHAFATGRPLGEVAKDIVDRRLVIDRDH